MKVTEETICCGTGTITYEKMADGEIRASIEIFTYACGDMITNDAARDALADKLEIAIAEMRRMSDPFAPNVPHPANPPALSELVSETTRIGLDNARLDRAEYDNWAAEKNL